MKKDESGFVLLPGGGLSSWVWRDLLPLLNLKAVTFNYRLPVNTSETRKNSTIDDCVNHIINGIEENHLKKIIIAGHSGSGVLAARVAKKIPEKINHVVYISGNIPPHNNSALDALPFILRMINSIVIKTQINQKSTPAIKKAKIIRQYMCNNCSEEILDYILQQDLLSEPLCVAFEKNDWQNFPDVNQTYVLLKKDKTQSLEKQKKMMNNLSVKDSYIIDSDHMVMLSNPGELSKFLNSLVK